MDTDVTNIYWYDKPKKEAHDAIFGLAKKIISDQGARRAKNLFHMSLYNGAKNRLNQVFPPNSNLPNTKLNIVHSMCTTGASQVTSNPPRPKFMTKGGKDNYKNKKKAKLLQQFIEGIYYQTDAYEIASQCVFDATQVDIAGLKVFPDLDSQEIKIERVYCNEILVDEADAFYGDPSFLFQYKRVPRQVLMAKFAHKPNFKRELKYIIENAGDKCEEQEQKKEQSDISDMVAVIEAYKRPLGKKDKGRRVLCLDTGVLEDGEWNRGFPFVWYKWDTASIGFYGMSLCEHVAGLQAAVDKTEEEIQLGLHLFKPYWITTHGSTISKSAWSNQYGRVIHSDGDKPELVQPNSVSPDVFTYLQWQMQTMYELGGISQLSAQSKKPEGLDSAPALQEYYDISAEKLQPQKKRYELMHMSLTEELIHCAKYINDNTDGGYKVPMFGKDSYVEMDFREIDIDEDAYQIQIFPTSMIPATPAGKMDFANLLVKTGFVEDKTIALSIIDFPDTDGFIAYATAELDSIKRAIDIMLDPDDGEYQHPEPYYDPVLAIKLAKGSYYRAQEDGCPEHLLDNLREFMGELADILADKQAAAQPPPMPAAPPQPEAPIMDQPPIGQPLPGEMT